MVAELVTALLARGVPGLGAEDNGYRGESLVRIVLEIVSNGLQGLPPVFALASLTRPKLRLGTPNLGFSISIDMPIEIEEPTFLFLFFWIFKKPPHFLVLNVGWLVYPVPHESIFSSYLFWMLFGWV